MIFLFIQISFFTLYLSGVFQATVILREFLIINLLSPVVVTVIILYYECKLSGTPQSRFSQQKVRLLTIAVVIWSMARVIQCWSSLYDSRRFLAIVLSM